MSNLQIFFSSLSFIGLFIGTIKFRNYLIDRRKKKLKQIPIEEVTYKQVVDDYNKLTPYQRRKSGSTYRGVKVRWLLKFHAIAEFNKLRSVGMIMCVPTDNKWQSVNFEASLVRYPILKSANQDDLFNVTGQVKNVDGSIYLKIIDLERQKQAFVY